MAHRPRSQSRSPRNGDGSMFDQLRRRAAGSAQRDQQPHAQPVADQQPQPQVPPQLPQPQNVSHILADGEGICYDFKVHPGGHAYPVGLGQVRTTVIHLHDVVAELRIWQGGAADH
eukprot:9484204-Pyramimonas_sp.AAC.2